LWGASAVQIFDTWDRNVISLIMFLIVAILAWLIWNVLQWWLALRVYTDEQFPTPAITREHVEALRKIRFAWNTWIESGGPVVDQFTPYGSENMAADLGPIIGTRDRVTIARFHREVSETLIWALDKCALAPGQYRLAHLTNSFMQQRLRQDLAGLPETRIEEIVAELPRLEPDGYFQFTDQHRRLLQHLRFEWPAPQHMSTVASGGYPVPTVHFKRPFGDMTAFEIDMAEILELPRPAPDRLDPLLERLYWETWPALQTFVEHATIEVPSVSRTGDGCDRPAARPDDKARAAGIQGVPGQRADASAIEAYRVRAILTK
jgi:hypothetical protein